MKAPKKGPAYVPDYALRFVTRQQGIDLVNSYHLARTALSGLPDQSRYARIRWAVAHISERDGISFGGAYKDLCGLLE